MASTNPYIKNKFIIIRTDSDDDLAFIPQHKSTQTEDPPEYEELLEYKNSFNELNAMFQELQGWYEYAKERFRVVKETNEELEAKLVRMPLAYKNAYHDTSERLLRVQKECRELRDKLREAKKLLA